jgi:uncharacterized protein YkwD
MLLPPAHAAGPSARRTRRLALAGVVAWAALATGGACAGPEGDGVQAVRGALGEPTSDYPAYEERVALYATNRARVSPTTEGWPTYPAEPPFQWNYDLDRSSRAHSTDMRDTPCFQHPSCDGTDTFTRVLTFYKGPWSSLAENIAAGTTDPQTVVHNWINEIGSGAGVTGHRDAIFSASLTLIGNGFAAGGTAFSGYWTQDFVGTPVQRPRLTDGIHFPKTVAANGKITFGATYYDAAVGAGTPQVFAVVDGTCDGLTRIRGTAGLGAHEGAFALADGCHPYYFVATLGDGVALATYPSTGALQVGVGSAAASCALFVTLRAAVACGGEASGSTGGGGAAGSAGAGDGGATGTIAGQTGAAGAGVAGSIGTTGTGGSIGTGTGGSTGTGTGAGGGSAGTGTGGGSAGAGTGTGGGGSAGTGGTTDTGGGGTSATPTGAAGASGSPSHGVVGSGCSVAGGEPPSGASLLWLLAAAPFVGCPRRKSKRYL